MEADDLLGEPYSFGECYSKTCHVKAKCNAWTIPEHEIKIFIRRRGDFVEILLPELIYSPKNDYEQKDIITIDLNLLDSELEKFFGKTRFGRQFCGLGVDNRSTTLVGRESYPCTFTLTKDGKIYIAPSDVCFGFFTHKTAMEVGTFSTVLSFVPDDSEPENVAPEAKKAAI